MASDRATLIVHERGELGSRETRRLRREGLVPGVVYGGGEPARAFKVPEREARLALAHGGALIDLRFDGSKPVPVVVKEQQRHPTRDQLLHLDFQEVKLDVAIHAEVPIELLGTEDAPGVKAGGVLEHVTYQWTVEALPTAIPDSIAADVSGMEIGDTLTLTGVLPPEGVEFVLGEGVDAEEVTVATLSPPRVEEEPEPEIEEEAELVGEEAPAAEAEAAEGEAGGEESSE